MRNTNELKQYAKELCIKNGRKDINNFCHILFYEVPIPKELKKYLSTSQQKN